MPDSRSSVAARGGVRHRPGVSSLAFKGAWPKPDTAEARARGVWLRPSPADRWPSRPGPMPDSAPPFAARAGVRHRPAVFSLAFNGAWPKPDTAVARAGGVWLRPSPADRWPGRPWPMPDSDPPSRRGPESGIGRRCFRWRSTEHGRSRTPRWHVPEVSGFGQVPPTDGQAVPGRCLTPLPRRGKGRSQASAGGVFAGVQRSMAEARHRGGTCREVSGFGPVPPTDGQAVPGRCLTPILRCGGGRSQASAGGVFAGVQGSMAEAGHRGGTCPRCLASAQSRRPMAKPVPGRCLTPILRRGKGRSQASAGGVFAGVQRSMAEAGHRGGTCPRCLASAKSRRPTAKPSRADA